MRQVVCDSNSCSLSPSNPSLTVTNMTGGNVGISPEEQTYYIPLESKSSKGLKRKRQSQIGGGLRKKAKKGKIAKPKAHCKTKRRPKRTCVPRRKNPRRKCVPRKK